MLTLKHIVRVNHATSCSLKIFVEYQMKYQGIWIGRTYKLKCNQIRQKYQFNYRVLLADLLFNSTGISLLDNQ